MLTVKSGALLMYPVVGDHATDALAGAKREAVKAVHGFVDRIFSAGIVHPFRAEAPADAEERSE